MKTSPVNPEWSKAHPRGKFPPIDRSKIKPFKGAQSDFMATVYPRGEMYNTDAKKLIEDNIFNNQRREETMKYKDHVKELPCLICGQGNVDPCHLKSVGIGRRRSLPKWEDYTITPLCREHHQELHQIGISQFEKKYKINLYKEALKILAKWIFNKDKL